MDDIDIKPDIKRVTVFVDSLEREDILKKEGCNILGPMDNQNAFLLECNSNLLIELKKKPWVKSIENSPDCCIS